MTHPPWEFNPLCVATSAIRLRAIRFHADHSYVARTVRLASLAPDIVEAIVRGDEPDGLTTRRLMRPWPLRWDEQRTKLCGDSQRIPTAVRRRNNRASAVAPERAETVT